MNGRWLVMVLGLCLPGLAGALTAGCKAATCEDVCEHQNGCEGQEQIPDCQAYCDGATQAAEKTGCADEYDALISCQGTIDTCSADTVSTFCSAQSAAYLKCASDACSEDPSKCSG